MHQLLEDLIDGITFTGNIRKDMVTFLVRHGLAETAGHCSSVGAEAKRVARRFGEDETRAEIAGWLHDVSAVFPTPERTNIARTLGVDVIPEEDAFPMIIHQKLSVVLARECFGIDDDRVLSAIGCHTTLKAPATQLDKVVFIADKIAWDQPGKPPYLDDLQAGLDESLDAGTLVYLRYLWEQRDTLKVVHPWFVDAYQVLSDSIL